MSEDDAMMNMLMMICPDNNHNRMEQKTINGGKILYIYFLKIYFETVKLYILEVCIIIFSVESRDLVP